MINLHKQYTTKERVAPITTYDVQHCVEAWKTVKKYDGLDLSFHILNDYVCVTAKSNLPDRIQMLDVFQARRIGETDNWTAKFAVKRK